MNLRSKRGEGSSTVKENDTISMINEMSSMSFEPARNSVDRRLSLDRKTH